jgi:formylglycine-generating enzyme required for sulfatase activity
MRYFIRLFTAVWCGIGVFGGPPAKAEEEHWQAEAEMLPGRVFRDCPECPEMVVVPAGSFMMGSPPGEAGRNANEGPQHLVTIARPFAVGKFEVTFAQWDACVAAGGCQHRPKGTWARDKHPVMDVSWDHITNEYLPWLARKTARIYRLLTEAEWEYAARAGTTTRYAFGDTISKKQANYRESRMAGPGRALEVGFYPANRFGLHDMHGNVWEWVQDCGNTDYNGAPSDGSAWTTGDCGGRVLRGGSFDWLPEELRSARRESSLASRERFASGFRVARTLTP